MTLETLYLHQTLHGYADGHQLLASSLDLSKDQQSLLLVMSDLSGPAFRNGYESYLTGYAIPGGGFYCLARTWFAPELPRPGCVWTHTLLIRDEDVARVKDFRALKTLFRRPTNEIKFDGYESRILFEERDSFPPTAANDGRGILAALYGSGLKLVIPSEATEPLEDLVLRIVSQQWPRLRRSFRFCTGALSLRETEFDLSVSPPEVTHSIGDNGLVIQLQNRDIKAAETWIEFANEDLFQSQIDTQFRKFLWLYGPDHADGRSAFRPLAETFLLIHSTETPAVADKVLSAIAHYFSDQSDARRLKMELFGTTGKYTRQLGGESTILRLLVSHPSAACIGPDTSNIKDRAAGFSKDNFNEATDIALLAAQIGGDNAQQFLDGFFEHGNWPSEAIENAPALLVPLILQRMPSLITNPALWTRSDHASIASKFVPHIEKTPSLLGGAMSAMMDAGAWDAVATLVDHFGVLALSQFFAHIDASQSKVLDVPDAIYAMLGSLSSQWVNLAGKAGVGPRSLRLLSAELDPRSWYAREIDTSAWLSAAALSIEFSDKERSLRSAVFFLSTGLRSWDATVSAVMVASNFSKVYYAAKGNLLKEWLWEQLEPSLSWYSPSWDRCARLVKTVASAFKERAWPADMFCTIFQTGEECSRALMQISEMWRGRRVVDQIKEFTRSNKDGCSQEQFGVISRFES